MVEMILHVDDKNGRKPDYRSPISAPSSAPETAYRPNTFSELCLGVGGRGVNPHDDQPVWVQQAKTARSPRASSYSHLATPARPCTAPV
jgi:hypothetical protein